MTLSYDFLCLQVLSHLLYLLYLHSLHYLHNLHNLKVFEYIWKFLPWPREIQTFLNPIWTGLFANLKNWGEGGKMAPSPNLAISSQITMKLGKDILWVEIFTYWQNFFMRSSSCWLYDVIKRWQLKKLKVFEGLAEYLKTVQLIFTKLMSFLGNHV